MEVHELLAQAWQEVEQAGLPPELNQVAFREAVRLLGGPQEQQPRQPPKGGAPDGGKAPRTRNSASGSPDGDDGRPVLSEDEFIANLARETGVAADKLEQVFHLDGANPRLNLPARVLGGNNKERMVTVSQLVPVARQYGLDEKDTPTRAVRDECARLKCLDEKNINTYFSNLVGITYAGPRNAKVLKVRPNGVEEFSRVIERLVGEPEG